MELASLHHDYRTSVARWIQTQENIVRYNPRIKTKRSIIQKRDPEAIEWTKERLKSLDSLKKVKNLGLILSALNDACNLIIGVAGSGNSDVKPELISGLDYHLKCLWYSRIPEMCPEFFNDIPEEVLLNLMLNVIYITPENRKLIRNAFNYILSLEC